MSFEARFYERLQVGLGAVGFGDATASEMVAAAQKSLAAAQAQYAALVYVANGQPQARLGFTGSESASGLAPSYLASTPDAGNFPQGVAYNQNMNQTMQAFVAAAKLALDAVQYVAARNASANGYVSQVNGILQTLQSDAAQVLAGSLSVEINWQNCTYSGSAGNSTVTCSPNAGWLGATYAASQAASQAIQYAQAALVMPSTGPSPAPVTVKPLGPVCPQGQIMVNGKCVSMQAAQPSAPVARGGRLPSARF